MSWFEEPVSSDDLEGLREVRDACQPDVAAGEYGYDLAYFGRMLEAGAVDCLQVDVSRCAGITEWQRVAALAAAHHLQVSAHCAQSLTAHVACAVPNLRHLEYFADHARVDRLLFDGVLFDGVLDPAGGVLRPDLSRPGMGLELKRADANRYAKERRDGVPKVVVVTGGSDGVGRATVREFAERGADVGLLARGGDGLAAAAEEVEAMGRHAVAVPTDVADPDQVEAAAERIEDELEPIAVWVNNAMTSVFAPNVVIGVVAG